MKNIFEKFDCGKLETADSVKKFVEVEWSKHPTFDGVELKHIVTSADTTGLFSYHLVRIAPKMKIGNHIHKTQLETHEVIGGDGICFNNGRMINYEVGTVSIIDPEIPHEVTAGENGLLLFAKFIPPLC